MDTNEKDVKLVREVKLNTGETIRWQISLGLLQSILSNPHNNPEKIKAHYLPFMEQYEASKSIKDDKKS